jgi:hypothetical protein
VDKHDLGRTSADDPTVLKAGGQAFAVSAGVRLSSATEVGNPHLSALVHGRVRAWLSPGCQGACRTRAAAFNGTG